MKKLLLLPCLFIALTSVAQTELFMYSNGCATVSTSERNHAFGDDGYEAFSLGNDAIIIRSFIRFDLSSIPVGSRLNWAVLGMNIRTNYGANTFLLRRITSPWDPARVTWNTQPATTKRSTVRMSAKGLSHVRIDVWKLVQAMIDSPATSFGFALKLDTEHGNIPSDISFFSPVNGQPRNVPQLTLEYTSPGFVSLDETSISMDSEGSTEMNIYPNPCIGIFNCKIKSASADIASLRVMDILGRTVCSQPVNTSSLQMQVTLPTSSAGAYFVILQNNKGATIVSQQLQVN